MARENIEDVIKKVILGEGFLAETAQDPDPTEDEDTSEEDASSDEGFEVEEIDEAKCDAEDEDEESEDDAEEDEDEEETKGKKKMPAFLKGKFGKKGKTEMEEAVSDYASEKLYKTANGKGAAIAAPTGDDSGKNKGTIKAKPSAAKAETKIPSVQEDIAAMLTGENLSEEFKTSAATLFEAHLNERVHQIEEELKGQYEDLLEQHTVAVTEELVERIDDYLNYVVEEWMQENRLAVEKGLRTEITENFISNLKGLFTESYIEVPEDKLDLFESTVDQAEALDSELQGQVEKNMELSEEVEQLKCEIIFREISEGMTDTEVEKLRRLAEDLEFDTIEQFAEKISVLCENIGSIGTVAEEAPSEEGLEESYEDASEATPLVEAYVRSMSKSRE
tara:strand:- start:2758 stop:3933 length:1176 start_codon:yes stop_codon:yes gene_type:complete